MKYIVIKFFFIISTHVVGQNTILDLNEKVIHADEIFGTWKDSIPFPNGSLTPQGIIIINADSILISRRKPGHHSTTQLLKYKIINDTIFAKEIKFISIDENAGIAHRYLKNRKIVTIIPLCHFLNACFVEKHDRMTNPNYTAFCFKLSNQRDIANQFKQAMSIYRRCKGRR